VKPPAGERLPDRIAIAPAPVIARSLGFHDKTTTRVAAEMTR